MTGYQSKRAAAQDKSEQKPVAWLEPEWGEKICPEVGYEVTMTDDHPRDLGWIPLVAQPAQEPEIDLRKRWPMNGWKENKVTPPQRPWVGLTDDEIDQGLLRTTYALQTAGAWREGVRWAYHQLKEKNT